MGVHTYFCLDSDGKGFLASTIVTATNTNGCTCSPRPAGHEVRMAAAQSLCQSISLLQAALSDTRPTTFCIPRQTAVATDTTPHQHHTASVCTSPACNGCQSVQSCMPHPATCLPSIIVRYPRKMRRRCSTRKQTYKLSVACIDVTLLEAASFPIEPRCRERFQPSCVACRDEIVTALINALFTAKLRISSTAVPGH